MRTRAMYDVLAWGAVAGTEPWATLWQEGHGQAWYRSTTYISDNVSVWRATLVDQVRRPTDTRRSPRPLTRAHT
jgi:hypothetical protein